MNIAGIQKYSRVNGPGLRAVIWAQGCSIHCKDCINKHLWSVDGGKYINSYDLVKTIRNIEGIDGVTISGGEPLMQYDSLLYFCAVLNHEQSKHLNIVLFSGYDYETINLTYKKILCCVDVLITGPYKKTSNKKTFLGSINKKIHYLTDKIKPFDINKETEVFINNNGDMNITGFTKELENCKI